MKVLVVGGTGMIGGTTALYLQSLGHNVTITGRKPSPPANQRNPRSIAIVFSAGTDGRHIPPKQQAEADKYYLYSNGEAAPAFARLIRDAGVRIFVNIGSYTHHAAPEQVEEAAYVPSRKQAADGIVALASPSFYACSLDAPMVVGNVPGMRVPIFEALVN
ncbi:hypothetical protein Neosp_001319 [[Neocosmospora] mangrovei]